MSRNLATTCCHRCRAPSVCLDEEPRLITEAEAGCHFYEYLGMKVAHATCPRCQARYLAWVQPSCWVCDAGYFALSYRSTFNNEPGLDDLPKPDILVELDEQLKYVPLDDAACTAVMAHARNLLAKCLGWVE